MGMQLTEENYYSDIANYEYMSVSQFKDFNGTYGRVACEEAALAKLKGEYAQASSTALMVGSYVDRYFEGTLDAFKSEHTEMFKKDGNLKAEYVKADALIQRAERDELFMKYMSGEKQVIMTAELYGTPWKIKMDSYIPGVAIVDLKVMASLTKLEWVRDIGYLDFVRYWGYDIQGAIYQEVVYQNTGKRLPFYIAGISKESTPNIEIIHVQDNYLREAREVVKANINHVLAVKRGEIEPLRCHCCDYCRETKVLKRPIGIADLVAEVYGRWELDTGAQAMRYEDFIAYAKRLAVMGVQGFILTGGGEPTINPDFEKIAGWLTENNFQWGINTNFNKLVKVKPNYLKVSLDAYSNESYEQLRGVAAYETVRENIKAYAAWKKENSPGTSLGIQQLVKEPEDVKRFYDANKDLDVDYMVFRPVESTAGSYYRDERKKRDAEEIKKIVSDMAMDDERVTLNFKWGLLDRQEERCTASWAQMALNEKGEVMYCCHKPYQIIGHIMDEDILAKKMAAVTDMSMCDIPCRMTAPNLEVKKMEQARKDACFI